MTLRKARLGALGSYFKARTTLGFNFCKSFSNLITSDGHFSKVILPEVLSMGLRDDLDRVHDYFVDEKSFKSRSKVGESQASGRRQRGSGQARIGFIARRR